MSWFWLLLVLLLAVGLFFGFRYFLRARNRPGLHIDWQPKKQRHLVVFRTLWGKEEKLYYIKTITSAEIKKRRDFRRRNIKDIHYAVYHVDTGKLQAIMPSYEQAYLWVLHRTTRRTAFKGVSHLLDPMSNPQPGQTPGKLQFKKPARGVSDAGNREARGRARGRAAGRTRARDKN